MKKTNTLILVCCHNQQNILETDKIKPILVGAEISKLDIYPYKDNMGEDNISLKNKDFNELTAMYWAWRNLPEDITNIGFFHYRRYLSLKNTKINNFTNHFSKIMKTKFGFSSHHIENLSKNYDIILPKRQIPPLINLDKIQYLTMKEHFITHNSKAVLDEIENIILEQNLDYKEAMEISFNEKSCYFKNMFIMKRKIFNHYMEFLFGILFEFEKRNQNNKITNQPRIAGFIAERLINIYINKLILDDKSIKIIEFPVLRKFHLNIFNKAYLNKMTNKIKQRMNLDYLINKGKKK